MLDDFSRRTLRTWAVLDGLYAALVITLVMTVLPWKWPAANLALLVYAGSIGGAAWGLWRARRWAWRLALVTSLIGLALAAAVVSGLFASWAYLRAVYGVFGMGASIASLLIAGMVWQVLGLYPAIRLRALLRREVRAFVLGAGAVVRGAGPRAGLGAPEVAAVVLLLLPFLIAVVVHARFSLRVSPAVPEAALAQSLAVLRARADGRPPPAAPALAGVPAGPGPLHVTLWRDGQAVWRVHGQGSDLASAVQQAGVAVEARLRGAGPEQRRGRLKVDRVVGRAPVPLRPAALLGLSVDPGLDGLEAPGRPVVLPDDMLAAGVAGAEAPLPFLDELRLGIAPGWLRARLGPAPGALTRFRVESWIEGEDGPGGVRRVHRGLVLPRTGGGAGTRDAAVLAGDFMLRQLQSDGRFGYRYDPLADDALPTGVYSIPRHAGTAYGLTLLFAGTAEPRFREGASSALGWLGLHVVTGCAGADTACLREGGRASVGPAALTAIAMLEYQRRTGDRRYQGASRGLLAFLRHLQQPNGEFQHLFDAEAGVVLPGPPRMFASEQAALALVLGHRVLGDPADLSAAERALDYLTGAKYDFFLGRFIYGADHWTCIAAEEAWPALQHRRYLDFCSGYADFMGRLQYAAAEGRPWGDFAGHYGFSHLLVPQAPGTAGFAEALVSSLALAGHHGVSPGRVARLRDQTRAALAALARDQLRPDNTYLLRNPERAKGGFRRSLVEPEVRIDFVQHAASALIRGHGLGVL